MIGPVAAPNTGFFSYITDTASATKRVLGTAGSCASTVAHGALWLSGAPDVFEAGSNFFYPKEKLITVKAKLTDKNAMEFNVDLKDIPVPLSDKPFAEDEEFRIMKVLLPLGKGVGKSILTTATVATAVDSWYWSKGVVSGSASPQLLSEGCSGALQCLGESAQSLVGSTFNVAMGVPGYLVNIAYSIGSGMGTAIQTGHGAFLALNAESTEPGLSGTVANGVRYLWSFTPDGKKLFLKDSASFVSEYCKSNPVIASGVGLIVASYGASYVANWKNSRTIKVPPKVSYSGELSCPSYQSKAATRTRKAIDIKLTREETGYSYMPNRAAQESAWRWSAASWVLFGAGCSITVMGLAQELLRCYTPLESESNR